MQSKISAVGTAVPDHKISQTAALEFMVKMNAMNDEEARSLEVLYRASGISERYTILDDYTRLSDFKFFPNNDTEVYPSTKKRMAVYRKAALKLSMDAIENCLLKTEIDKSQLTHLITVTCTGLHAPGLDLDLVQSLGLPHTIERTNINFMGCYAAFNALKTANAICKSQDAKVLIVCTELCTLHFQKGTSEDDLLANALFGDGSAAVLVESETSSNKFFGINKFNCDILPSGKDEMAWGLGPLGFEMRLSTYVPEVIEKGIDQLLAAYRTKFDYYAIHPGGKRILKVIEGALGIAKTSNTYAHEVLRNFGNMSSPTVLFVLKKIFDLVGANDNGKEILAMAFGPGITLESMTFNIQVR